MKKEKGITLVSLVVTIIILIILAGISINATLGENGIITISKRAKENMQLAQIEEQTKLNELYIQMASEGGTSGGISYDAIAKLTEFKKVIAEAITNNGIETKEDDTAEKMAENIGIIKNNEEEATTKLLEFKTKIAEAITNNGVETKEDDTAEKMAENIGIIKNNEEEATTKLLEFKTKIAEAITNKGIETSENDTVETMVENIGNIGNAGKVEILETGKINTGSIYCTQGKTITINLNNTYTEEDNATFFYNKFENGTGQLALYLSPANSGSKIIGNKLSFYVMNLGGSSTSSGAGSIDISYMILRME